MLDLVLGGILAVSAFAAARNGITREAIRIASLVAGLMVAMWGHGLLGRELEPWIADGRVASAAAFAILFLACLLAGALLAYALAGVWKLTGMAWLDMTLGAGFGMIRGLLISAALLLGLVAFQPFADTSGLVAGSRIAPWVMNLARTAATMAPRSLKDAFGRGADVIDEKRSEGKA